MSPAWVRVHICYLITDILVSACMSADKQDEIAVEKQFGLSPSHGLSTRREFDCQPSGSGHIQDGLIRNWSGSTFYLSKPKRSNRESSWSCAYSPENGAVVPASDAGLQVPGAGGPAIRWLLPHGYPTVPEQMDREHRLVRRQTLRLGWRDAPYLLLHFLHFISFYKVYIIILLIPLQLESALQKVMCFKKDSWNLFSKKAKFLKAYRKSRKLWPCRSVVIFQSFGVAIFKFCN